MKQSILKKTAAVIVLFGLFAKVVGQSSDRFIQYELNPVSINPAYAGREGALNLSLFYNKQWTGIEGSPQNMTFSADAPFLNRKLGVAIVLNNEQFGVTQQNDIATKYAYRLIFPNSELSFGLGASLKLINSNFSDLSTLDPGDEKYLQNSKTYPLANFSFGLHYALNSFYAGFSIPQLLNYSFDIDTDKYLNINDLKKYRYLFQTGYAVTINNDLKVSPSVLLQYSEFDQSNNFLFDLNTMIYFKDLLGLGGSYQNERSFETLFQINPNKQINFAYSYSYELSRLSRYTGGSHQLFLKYIFRYKIHIPSSLIF